MSGSMVLQSRITVLLTRCTTLKCFMFIVLCVVAAMVILHIGLHGYPCQRQGLVLPSSTTARDGATHNTSLQPGMTSIHSEGPSRQCSSSGPPTNIVFIKVQKCGSTTVSNLLARYALNHDLNVALPEQKPVGFEFHCFGADPFRESRVLPLAEGQPYHVLFNHMVYNRTALNIVMPKNAFYVAIMRQPEERFLSSVYFFGKLRPPAANDTDNAAFKRFISDSSRQNLEKIHYVYNTLVFDTGLPLKEQKNAGAVKKHLERLDQELDLVMVMEHFLESLVLLKRGACLSLRDVVFMKKNVRPHHVHHITPQDRSVLKAWQMAEHMAYDHFYARFWALVRQEGDSFPQEVEHLRQVMNHVTSYCSSQRPQWDVLVIHKSPWNEEFSLNSRDCEWMVMHEYDVQKRLLTRAKTRRDSAGYKESRHPVPHWSPSC